MDRVSELTGGEVKFRYFGAGQLGSLRDMFSQSAVGAPVGSLLIVLGVLVNAAGDMQRLRDTADRAI